MLFVSSIRARASKRTLTGHDVAPRRLAAVVAVVGLLSTIGVSASADGSAPTTTPATAVPVDIDLGAKGSITVTRYAHPGTDAVAHDDPPATPDPGRDVLSGVEFTVRSVFIDLSNDAGWEAVDTLEPYAGEDLAETADGAAFSLGEPVTNTTGTDGVAAFHDLPVGVYLVEETGIGANPVTERAAPLYVTIPLPDTESGEWLYDVFVYPTDVVASTGQRDGEGSVQETDAPAGDEPLPDAQDTLAGVPAGSTDDAETATVDTDHAPTIHLPHTGADGAAAFPVAELTLMAMAAVLVVAGRRRATSQA